MQRLRPRRVPLPSAALLQAAAASAALLAALPAQQQFVPLRPQLPTGHDCVVRIAGDIDGDGDLDLVCAELDFYVQPVAGRLLLNAGDGSFRDAPAGSLPATASGNLVLGDVDGDGDLDIVSVNNSYTTLQPDCGLFLNDGSGTFIDVSATNMPPNAGQLYLSGTLTDIDGDGDLDLVFGVSNTLGDDNRVYVNDGAGVFTDETNARFPSFNDRTSDVLAADFDGDGDQDLFFANGAGSAGQNRLLRNDGLGFFTDVTASQLPQSTDLTRNAVAADFDGDGDVDIACGIAFGSNRLLINDGTGTFTDEAATRLPTDSDSTTFVAGDLDGDGDADLLAVNSGFCSSLSCASEQSRLYRNNGTGTFADATARLALAPDRGLGGVLGDLDADGDLDIAVGSISGGFPTYQPSVTSVTTILLNVQRQLDAPTPPQLGQPYDLDAYLRFTPSGTGDLAAVYLSPAPASVATPFGALGIDPALAAPFPTLVIPQPQGVGTVGFAVPNSASLAGQAIYSQAMLVTDLSELRLSNVVLDVIQ